MENRGAHLKPVVEWFTGAFRNALPAARKERFSKVGDLATKSTGRGIIRDAVLHLKAGGKLDDAFTQESVNRVRGPYYSADRAPDLERNIYRRKDKLILKVRGADGPKYYLATYSRPKDQTEFHAVEEISYDELDAYNRYFKAVDVAEEGVPVKWHPYLKREGEIPGRADDGPPPGGGGGTPPPPGPQPEPPPPPKSETELSARAQVGKTAIETAKKTGDENAVQSAVKKQIEQMKPEQKKAVNAATDKGTIYTRPTLETQDPLTFALHHDPSIDSGQAQAVIEKARSMPGTFITGIRVGARRKPSLHVKYIPDGQIFVFKWQNTGKSLSVYVGPPGKRIATREGNFRPAPADKKHAEEIERGKAINKEQARVRAEKRRDVKTKLDVFHVDSVVEPIHSENLPKYMQDKQLFANDIQGDAHGPRAVVAKEDWIITTDRILGKTEEVVVKKNDIITIMRNEDGEIVNGAIIRRHISKMDGEIQTQKRLVVGPAIPSIWQTGRMNENGKYPLVYIVEGFADGATLAKLKPGQRVIVAHGSNNLWLAVRTEDSRAERIVILHDKDDAADKAMNQIFNDPDKKSDAPGIIETIRMPGKGDISDHYVRGEIPDIMEQLDLGKKPMTTPAKGLEVEFEKTKAKGLAGAQGLTILKVNGINTGFRLLKTRDGSFSVLKKTGPIIEENPLENHALISSHHKTDDDALLALESSQEFSDWRGTDKGRAALGQGQKDCEIK